MASKIDNLKAKRAAVDSAKEKVVDSVTDSIMHPKKNVEVKKTKRVSLIVDEELFDLLEAECKKLRQTKNGYVNMLLAKELLSK